MSFISRAVVENYMIQFFILINTYFKRLTITLNQDKKKLINQKNESDGQQMESKNNLDASNNTLSKFQNEFDVLKKEKSKLEAENKNINS